MSKEKPIAHARQIVEAFDDLLKGMMKHMEIDYAALHGALRELTLRTEYQHRSTWIAADEAERKKRLDAGNPDGEAA